MVLLGFVVGLALLAIGVCWVADGCCNGKEFTGWVFGTIGATLCVICFISGLFMVGDIAESKYIDDRIAMYQEENTKIEKDIETMVAHYMEHENKTFDMSEVESPITLVQMYPELKSDKLVQQQMKVFKENNDNIKSLKNRQISCEKNKFLLYFGGK